MGSPCQKTYQTFWPSHGHRKLVPTQTIKSGFAFLFSMESILQEDSSEPLTLTADVRGVIYVTHAENVHFLYWSLYFSQNVLER